MMKHVFATVACMGLLLGLAISDDEIAKHKQWMDDAQDWKEEIRELLSAGPASDVSGPARQLVAACEREVEFWTRAGIDEAVVLAGKNLRAARALQSGRSLKALAELDAGCRDCHDMHFERRLRGAGKR